MKMRTKTLIVVIVITATIIGIMHTFADYLILGSFATLEEKETQENVNRTVGVLSNELEDMDGSVSDWAFWDDTYIFVQDANKEYAELNLADSTFSNLRLNAMVFVNSSGQIVHSKAFNLETMSETAVLDSLLQEVNTKSQLWNYSTAESKTIGVLLLSDGPVLVASKPVLNSEAQGPIQGALIFVRNLDSYEIEYISDSVGLPFSLQTPNNGELPADFQSAYASLSQDTSVFVQDLSSDLIAGYAIMTDVQGRPAAILKIEMFRDVFKQGIIAKSYFMVTTVIISLVFGITILILLQTAVLSPLSKLTTSIRRLAKTSERQSIASKFGTEEMTILSETLKDTVSQRLATIEEMAGMVGHDLRNPLTGIAGATYYIRSKCSTTMDPRSAEMLKVIEENVEHSNRIINDLLDYSRKIKLDLQLTSPKSLIDRALLLTAIPSNIQLVEMVEEEPAFLADTHRLIRALTNIIKNAVEAMSDKGTLTIRSRTRGENVELSFTDTGTGMSKETLEKLWTPLFTTKAKGMGFGMPITKRFIEAHNGTIVITSAIGKGTTVTVVLPLRMAPEKGVEILVPPQDQMMPSQQAVDRSTGRIN